MLKNISLYAILERWKEYIGDLFDDNRPEMPKVVNLDGPPILLTEVESALKRMKNGKAAGEDGITAEMLKALHEFGIQKLTTLFNNIYDTGFLPEEMLSSTFITLPKKPKASECGDYRTLSLMSHITKLLLCVIQARIQKKIDVEVGETQFGFCKESGTREGIFSLNAITQKYIDVKEDLYLCFIDYSKAFDRVHLDKLIQCLYKIGLDGKDINLIASLYWNQKAAIRIEDQLSDHTKIQRGVRQGCVLSPYLFNIYTEFIFRESEDLEGVSINGKNINNLRYADDTVLLAESKDDLQILTNNVRHYSKQSGLDMNVKKTKTMVISRDIGTRANISIDNEELEQVEEFKYLGQTITADAKTEKEIKIRIGIAKSRFQELKIVLTNRRISQELRLRLVKCFVLSTFTYGCETWTLNKDMENKINAFEMWTLRKIANVKWTDRVTNDEVCRRLHVQRKLLSDIKQRKLAYFGHIKRHHSLRKELLEGRVQGKRGRGRPPRRWEDDVKAWTGMGLSDCTRAAADRDVWRDVSRRPRPP